MQSIRIVFLILFVVIVLLAWMYHKDTQEKRYLQQLVGKQPLVKSPRSDSELAGVQSAQFGHGLTQIEIKQEKFDQLLTQLHKKVIGMDGFVHALVVNLLVGGHLLVEGVPGLAKTKTIATLAEVMELTFKRIQFTPDMLPGDITGVEVRNTKSKSFEINKGPLFAQMILADEINRTTPKVQSALLEAMQEHQVTIAGETLPLPAPFFVLATQNPIEHEGTYALPEAQIDRFLFKVQVDYPGQQAEQQMLSMIEHEADIELTPVMSSEELVQIQQQVAQVTLSPEIKSYIVRLVEATRQVPDYFVYGGSPRASIGLMKAAKAVAYLAERSYVTHADVQSVALAVLRHRVVPTPMSRRHGSVDELLTVVLRQVTLT